MLAIVSEKSQNKKLSYYNDVISTYTSIDVTCPRTCQLYKKGFCYAMYGNVRLHLSRMSGGTPLQAAKEEAQKIDSIEKPRGRHMRLHVAGDSRTKKGTQVLAKAVDRFLAKGGGTTWTYTHAWKTVERWAWGKISVLASLDNVEDSKKALERGYAPARYVAAFPASKWEEHGVTWIACPAQTGDNVCVNCGLCMKDGMLLGKKFGVAFEAHGCKTRKLREHINVTT